MRNAGCTIRHQGIAHWWQRLFCQWTDFESGTCTKEAQNHTQILRETAIHHSSVNRIVRQNLKLKCLNKCRAQLVTADCVFLLTCAQKLLRRFPASAVHFKFLTDELEHLIWWSFTVVWVYFVLTCLASDFAALCLCQQWPYLACFLFGLQLNTIH